MFVFASRADAQIDPWEFEVYPYVTTGPGVLEVETDNAVIATILDVARKRADMADAARARGESWGPLHGVPMTVKESYDVAGLPTTWGAPEFKDAIAQRNALAVDRLQGAGAVVFGKTNVPLMLSDFQSYNEIYGTTSNPWDVGRTPGGSSGGAAAALAAGLTGLEAGSDIGSSLRNPAHYCGIYAHKPTWGVVSPRGHAVGGRVSYSDISVVGPMARSAADLEVALGAMTGPDEIDGQGVRKDGTISLLDDQFELVLFEGASSFTFLKYMLAVVLRRHSSMRGITILRTRQVSFQRCAAHEIHVQVDGEYAGLAPASVEIVPNALTLLVPPRFRSRRPATTDEAAWTTSPTR
jgi:hypothetical protein